MRFSVKKFWQSGLILLLFLTIASAQSRNSARSTTDTDGTILSVAALRIDSSAGPIKPENLYLYENSVEQRIKNFSFDPSPARLLILAMNSQASRLCYGIQCQSEIQIEI